MEDKFNKWKNDCLEKLKTFEILSDFKGMSKKIKLKCLICGHIFEISPYDFKRKKTRGCKICDNNNRRRNKENFINSLKSKNKHFDDIIIGEYKSKRDKIDVTCKLCGHTHKYLPISLEAGCWCPVCKGSRLKTNKEFIDDLQHIHGKLVSVVNEYIDDSTKIYFKCNKCGYVWKQKPRVLLNGHGCPKCKMKHLEREIQNLFKNETVEFQKQFDWLKYKGKLFLDFYIPEYKIAIECQGEQHFKPIDFASNGKKWAFDNFQKNIIRDSIKKKLCENNGIKLLYYTSKKIINDINILDEKYNGIYTTSNLLTDAEKLKNIIYEKK
jgi:rubrerythrin